MSTTLKLYKTKQFQFIFFPFSAFINKFSVDFFSVSACEEPVAYFLFRKIQILLFFCLTGGAPRGADQPFFVFVFFLSTSVKYASTTELLHHYLRSEKPETNGSEHKSAKLMLPRFKLVHRECAINCRNIQIVRGFITVA